MVWYSHLFQNFPQFLVIHTVKDFGIVNKAEIDLFLELSCFFDDPVDVGNLTSGSSAFSKSSLSIYLSDFIFSVKVFPITFEILLDCKEIQPVRSKEDHPGVLFGRNDAKAETPVLWPLM